MQDEYTGTQRRAADLVQEMILNKLNELSEDMKKLWEANHEQAMQIANFTNPEACPYKHEQLKAEILNDLQAREDRSHKNLMDTIKIVGGSGGVVGLWQFVKWFILKGK